MSQRTQKTETPRHLTNSEPASFRDPRGRIVYKDANVYRVILPPGAEDYRLVRKALDQLVAQGLLLSCDEIDPGPFIELGAVHALRHPRIPVISYPYEWCFEMLKSAALLHLDLHLTALDNGATLSDGSAYNVQFLGPRPIFIDCQSVVPYIEGSHWSGHLQFCQQFLNPLLLTSMCCIPFQHWYRGAPEGLVADWLAGCLPLRSRLSVGMLIHVFMLTTGNRLPRTFAGERLRPLPLSGLRWMLRSLRRMISGLRPPPNKISSWTQYGKNPPFSENYLAAKRRAIATLVQSLRPRCLLDIGCNVGTYSLIASQAGAQMVVGLDSDANAVDEAYLLAIREGINFLPLVVDLANPSPNQGWLGTEKSRLESRLAPDALIAMAVIHHLCLGRFLPLKQVVKWLVDLAPHGLIEFVSPDDPVVTAILRRRTPEASEYNEQTFHAELSHYADILEVQSLENSGRRLYRYHRR